MITKNKIITDYDYIYLIISSLIA